MKKLLTIVVIALLAIAAWNSIDSMMDTSDMVVHFDDEEIGGPLGALLAVLFAGGGLLIAAVALTCAAVFAGLLFAGIGILMVAGLGLLAVVLAVVIAPLTLPLLIPLGIIWLIAARKRKQRAQAQQQEQQQYGKDAWQQPV